MVLTRRLARWAARRPHVLLAVAPGATAARLAVEAQLLRMGGEQPTSPADADVLLSIGSPGPELDTAIDQVWRQLPGPRARARVTEPQQAQDCLRVTLEALQSERDQAADAARRGDEWDEGDPPSDGGHEDGMQMPGGLMMADRGPDRDGLKLDVLRFPLGPVLPDWPAGLVVDLTVQGDVVQEASSRVLPSATDIRTPFWHGDGSDCGRRHAASYLDSLGRLLAVADWPAMSCRVRRLRDAVLAEVPAVEARTELTAIGRRLRRSVALRWATDGLGVLTAAASGRLGLGGPAARAVAAGGDATARWQCWLAEADRLLAGDASGGSSPRGDSSGGRPASTALLAAAEQLIVGLDVAAARLVLASFDPDPDELAEVRQSQGAGS